VNMALTPMSFRLPTETRDRIRALAQPGESLSSVIVRAVAALEAAPPVLTKTDMLLQQLELLEARLVGLEERSPPVAQQTLQTPQERSVNLVQVAPQGSSTSAAVQEVLTTALEQGFAAACPALPRRQVYPQEVRQMALAMADRGATSRAIRQAVEDACGHEPGSKNWSRVLGAWRRAAQD
ncbi:MAG: hypothetical protein ACOYB3_09855, partial [Azonexus sp.]